MRSRVGFAKLVGKKTSVVKELSLPPCIRYYTGIIM